jgi:ATP-dependent protease Clp ATPase subunit
MDAARKESYMVCTNVAAAVGAVRCSHRGQVDTSHILFICSGAFNGLEEIIANRLNVKVGLPACRRCECALNVCEHSPLGLGLRSAFRQQKRECRWASSSSRCDRGEEIDAPSHCLIASACGGQVDAEDLIKFGMIPEFIGRLPVSVALEYGCSLARLLRLTTGGVLIGVVQGLERR